jgi:hypothetical protein
MNSLRCYDNGGKTADRYTILPPRWARDEFYNERLYGHRLWNCLGASADPFHPQGVGMCGSAAAGPHLGKRIAFADLPEAVQHAARQVFPKYAK